MAIVDCTFKKNYGLNVADGAAIAIDGKQDAAFVQGRETRAAALQALLKQTSELSPALGHDEYPKSIAFGLNKNFKASASAALVSISDSVFE